MFRIYINKAPITYIEIPDDYNRINVYLDEIKINTTKDGRDCYLMKNFQQVEDILTPRDPVMGSLSGSIPNMVSVFWCHDINSEVTRCTEKHGFCTRDSWGYQTLIDVGMTHSIEAPIHALYKAKLINKDQIEQIYKHLKKDLTKIKGFEKEKIQELEVKTKSSAETQSSSDKTSLTSSSYSLYATSTSSLYATSTSSLYATSTSSATTSSTADKSQPHSQKKNIKAKIKIFPQSFVIDAAIARKHLENSGYEHDILTQKILYRGDERSPNIIFRTGFYRRIESSDIRHPSITKSYESKACIACTKTLVHAIGFADDPSTCQGFKPIQQYKKNNGWVYLLYSDQGIDLTKRTKNYGESHMGEQVQEVVLTGISPNNIIAAFQIQTTVNTISDYTLRPRFSISDDPESGHVRITDFDINTACFLKDSDPQLYKKELDNFKKYYEKGRFEIPWAKNTNIISYESHELKKKKDQEIEEIKQNTRTTYGNNKFRM